MTKSCVDGILVGTDFQHSYYLGLSLVALEYNDEGAVLALYFAIHQSVNH